MVTNKRLYMPIGLRLSREDSNYIREAVRMEKECRSTDVADVISFRLFSAVKGCGDAENHLVLGGGIAPVDWHGWNTYAPPLGKGCCCALIGITAGRARRLIESGEGFDLTQSIPDKAGPDADWIRAEGWWEKL